MSATVQVTAGAYPVSVSVGGDDAQNARVEPGTARTIHFREGVTEVSVQELTDEPANAKAAEAGRGVDAQKPEGTGEAQTPASGEPGGEGGPDAGGNAQEEKRLDEEAAGEQNDAASGKGKGRKS